MNAALLCNGPSKSLFDLHGKIEYDYIMGCNIPWTKVDSIMILDIEVAKYFYQSKLDNQSVWFSRKCWLELHGKEREHFDFKGIVDITEEDSCGHAALRKIIELGYDKIDIYGCDSYFEHNMESSTHDHVKNIAPNIKHRINVWRDKWNKIIENNKQTSINFIWYNKEIKYDAKVKLATR